MTDARQVDVAVVGAGLSGLQAARIARRAGRSVAVLEARDRVGGRTWTVEVGGAHADLGAHWIGRRHARLRRLAHEFGLTTVPQPTAGRHPVSFEGHHYELRGELPVRPVAGAVETAAAVAAFDLGTRLGRRVPPDRSMADRFASLRTPVARGTIGTATRTMVGLEPEELSVAEVRRLGSGGGGLGSLIRFRGGAQEASFTSGTQAIALGLAASLQAEIHTGSAVRRISLDGATFVVEGDGRTVRAERVIVALSHRLRSALVLDLPGVDAASWSRLPGLLAPCSYAKAVVAYDTPWWRDEIWSGIAFSDEGPVQMVVDGGATDGGHLVAFVTGAAARPFGRLDAGQRREAVVDHLTRTFGAHARTVVDYRDHDWTTDPWTGSGPLDVFKLGLGEQAAAAAAPEIPRLAWAGTESAPEFAGYMEGALLAGELAAQRVMADDA